MFVCLLIIPDNKIPNIADKRSIFLLHSIQGKTSLTDIHVITRYAMNSGWREIDIQGCYSQLKIGVIVFKKYNHV